jgi:predicted transcriptional regulator
MTGVSIVSGPRQNELFHINHSRDYETPLDHMAGGTYRVFMSAKELAQDVLKRLPENATMHELTEELYAAAVREGLDQLDRGEGIPHAEVQRQFDSWFTQ